MYNFSVTFAWCQTFSSFQRELNSFDIPDQFDTVNAYGMPLKAVDRVNRFKQ